MTRIRNYELTRVLDMDIQQDEMSQLDRMHRHDTTLA